MEKKLRRAYNAHRVGLFVDILFIVLCVLSICADPASPIEWIFLVAEILFIPDSVKTMRRLKEQMDASEETIK